MTDPSTLVQPHAAAIVGGLAESLASPHGRTRLKAAKLLLRWSCGPADGKRPARDATGPTGGLGDADLQRMLDLLLPHLDPAREPPLPVAAQSEAARPRSRPRSRPTGPRQSLPTAPKNTPLAEPALTPCPAAAPVSPSNPSANPMSREDRPSPLAVPPGTHPLDTRRRDADPMSRPLLPSCHSGSDFYRRLPTPPPMEPPWPFVPDHWQARRRRRWT